MAQRRSTNLNIPPFSNDNNRVDMQPHAVFVENTVQEVAV
jgi:hypothetical protein